MNRLQIVRRHSYRRRNKLALISGDPDTFHFFHINGKRDIMWFVKAFL